jgi:hypothetical protein
MRWWPLRLALELGYAGFWRQFHCSRAWRDRICESLVLRRSIGIDCRSLENEVRMFENPIRIGFAVFDGVGGLLVVSFRSLEMRVLLGALGDAF